MTSIQFTGISSTENEGIALIYFDIIDYSNDTWQWKDYIYISDITNIQSYLDTSIGLYTAQVDALIIEWETNAGKKTIIGLGGQSIEIDISKKEWVIPSPTNPPTLTDRIKTLESTIVTLNQEIEALKNP